jgi:hypothetical protein
MGFQKPKTARPHEPSGFTPRSSGRASERARQQGWQTNEEERTHGPEGKVSSDGGSDYDYGARDFGDLPANTSSAKPPAYLRQPEPRLRKKTTPTTKKAA